MGKRGTLNFRGLAVTIAVFLYAIAKSHGALTEFTSTLLPDNPAVRTAIKVIQPLFEGITLALCIFILEWLGVRLLTGNIRGEWIYRSSANNWGHVMFFAKGRELRYSVDLYQSKEDLLANIEKRHPSALIGHGVDQMVFYYGDKVVVWYDVPEVVKESVYYPKRKGILTLQHTNYADSWEGTWERIGLFEYNNALVAPGVIKAITEKDKALSKGTFDFFYKKAYFITGVCSWFR